MTHGEQFDQELQRRLDLLETENSGESYLPDLPALDLWIVVVSLLVLTVGLLIWSY